MGLAVPRVVVSSPLYSLQRETAVLRGVDKLCLTIQFY